MRTHFKLLAVIFLIFRAMPVAAGMDDARLKEWLNSGLFELLLWQDFDIKASDVTDEQFHRVLMELYREAEDKWQMLTPNTDAWRHNRMIVEGVLGCLPMCGDSVDKTLLLDLAADKTKDGFLRTIAVGSYLRAADPVEARDALLRFLAEENIGINKLPIYSHAREVFDKTPPEDTAKRRAIIAALMVAAAHEDGKIGFVEVDRIVAMRSDTYRRSRERLALLERHSLEPPTRNLYTDDDLKAALAQARKFRAHTSVNTNADQLKAHLFDQKPNTDGSEKWGGFLITPSAEAEFTPRGVPSVKPGLYRHSIWPWLAGILGLALGATGIWRLSHRRRANRD